ncbi:replication-associated recombination protein A [Candidatus Rhabdochlamydia porcellionis]|jgi:putative ATPase|uniref:Replication-associated recombination protein A n=1 Tax=Candidatus Rhabdochlamydia porcellionis TaxID=225148 RepID=A0ABX8YZJ9_9BACT|nr:replication-associated recombination protein A [Candidatus Rhabdochlamydia porcellionis]QZA58825.1 Replication-associated recombination protein A [Candidatus Rhabdochlamydia porcellionis]
MITPLAERLRPTQLDDIAGQEHLLSKNGLIKTSLLQKKPLSLLLWGPPGSGKTTLALAYSKAFDARFIPMSAVSHATSDIKNIIQDIQTLPLLQKRITILFVDEIHRWNKAQQDLFLPYLESGLFILIGATTENPSFALNNALLSRFRVLQLHSLSSSSLHKIINRYEEKYTKLLLCPKAKEMLITAAQGDGRHLINLIENLEPLLIKKQLIEEQDLLLLLQKKSPLYDRQSDQHYQLISALHKSIRGSDPDAALYWLARMLNAGEDPQFLARRFIRMAVEDIGLADPQALGLALHAWEAFAQLGAPEAELALAQAAVYLALSPKSNALYIAFNQAKEQAKTTSHLPPPAFLINSVTKLDSELGHGKGYQYDHDLPFAFSGQNYFPQELIRCKFYHPKPYGFEREMQKRVSYFEQLRKKNLPS